MSAPRLSEEQKSEMLRRYRSGESATAIAADYRVHSSYPGLLAKRRGLPVRASFQASESMSRAAVGRYVAGKRP